MLWTRSLWVVVGLVATSGLARAERLDQRRTASVSRSAAASRAALLKVPRGTIIDTHTHFFDPNRQPPPGRNRPIPWPPPHDPLYKPTLREDFLKIARPLGITHTVVVEASGWPEDNDWVLGLAADSPVIVGYVGNLSRFLGKPEFAQHLETFTRNRLFRGIRIGSSNVRNALAGGPVLDDLRRLARADLAVDTLGVSPAQVAELAARVPDLRIVIDHMGHVDARQPSEDWIGGITAAARHQNVYMKVSGLVENRAFAGGKAPSDPTVYRRALDLAFEAFGPDRLIYATNWPVCELYAPLSVVHGIVASYMKDRRADDREKLYWRNAMAAYKWVVR